MKKTLIFLCTCAAIMAGCKKTIAPDNNNKVETSSIVIAPPPCQATLIQGFAFYAWRQGLLGLLEYSHIEYNEFGKPLRALSTEPNFDSVVVHFFYYTTSNNLKQIKVKYFSTMVGDATTFYDIQYPGDGTTVITGRQVYQGITYPEPKRVVEFNNGRMSKITETYPTGVIVYNRFVYNSQGNLYQIYESSSDAPTEALWIEFTSYDDKINFCSTNSVWALIFEQYSTNNPVVFAFHDDNGNLQFDEFFVYTYNAHNYPKGQSHWTSADGLRSFKINYACSGIASN